jgi:hypothetical protein
MDPKEMRAKYRKESSYLRPHIAFPWDLRIGWAI